MTLRYTQKVTLQRPFARLSFRFVDQDSIWMPVVRELAGHEHVNTTDKYYNQILIERMKAELEKFEIPEIDDDNTPKKSLSSSLILLAS